MRIGLTGGATTVDKIVAQAQQAEADGFSALWYASAVAGDPLVAMAIAGRATSSVELGTAVLQTYPCHPLLQANRVAAASNAMGRPGLTLGIGASHESVVRGVLGLPYDHPVANTEEYLRIVTALLRGEDVDLDGKHWSVHTHGRAVTVDHSVPVLVAALGPRMLHVAGTHTDGVVLWMASAKAIEKRIGPTLFATAAAAGRPSPRIIAGLPVAVHPDLSEAREAVAATAGGYENEANYRRIIDEGGGSSAADLAIVGDEEEVRAGLQRLIDVGVTDVWAQPVAVGADRDDRRVSLQRTRVLLSQLTRE